MSTNNIGISKDVDDIISTLNNKFDNEKGLQLESELKNKLSKFGGGITGSLTISGDLVVDGNINASISGTSENAIKASKDAQGNIIDEHYATKEELNNKFDKTGGNISGTIVNTGPALAITRSTNNGMCIISGGSTDLTGACLTLRGVDYTTMNPGGWMLAARTENNEQESILVGSSNGSLTLNNKNIVRSVNNTTADDTGNVTINVTPSTVKGAIGSAVAANATSLTLPSGGTWFVWNIFGYNYYSSIGSDGVTRITSNWGVSTSSGTSSTGFHAYGYTYSGGTKIYAKKKSTLSEAGASDTTTYSVDGKLVAVRIS